MMRLCAGLGNAWLCTLGSTLSAETKASWIKNFDYFLLSVPVLGVRRAATMTGAGRKEAKIKYLLTLNKVCQQSQT